VEHATANTTTKSNIIDKNVSCYLDALRFASALVVVLHHIALWVLPGWRLPFPGHHAVIVFFVLSGFFILHVAVTKESTISVFAAARLSRILSVSVPALAVCFVMGALAQIPAATSHNEILSVPEHPAVAVLVNLPFLGEIWNWHISPPFNPPYWSLNYEVWYYVLFAACFFSRRRYSLLLAVACLLIAGYKIMLLMPCWLLGILLHDRVCVRPVSSRLGWRLCVGSIVCYLPFFWFDVPVLIRTAMDRIAPAFMSTLGASRSFVGDYVLALLVGANVVGFAAISRNWRWERPTAEKMIKWLANRTFSLYLFHVPAIALILQLRPSHQTGLLTALLALGAAIALPLAIAQVTELKRPAVHAELRRVFNPQSDRPWYLPAFRTKSTCNATK
jgi:peptidoglycan/LPS O-acetylase OafA/YrhL